MEERSVRLNSQAVRPLDTMSAAMRCAAALLPLCLALWLATRHPLSPTAASAGVAAMAALGALHFSAGMGVLLAVLPVIDAAPWTGWIAIEEWDLAALALAAGGHLRMGWETARPSSAGIELRAESGRPTGGLLLAAMAGLALLSLWIGLDRADNLDLDIWGGYRSPVNSIRLAKASLLVFLLAGPWSAQWKQAPTGAARWLLAGTTTAAATVVLALIWERYAYSGLADFSADYRTTALFWEMHVGGAALDGFLALVAPFCLMALLRARTVLATTAASALFMGLVYGSLVTFSRGVYAAIPVGLAITAALHRSSHGVTANPMGTSWLLFGVGGVTLATSAWLAFPSGGYRTVLAMILGSALVLAGGVVAKRQRPRLAALALTCGLVAATVITAQGAMGKVTYAHFFAAAVLAALCLGLAQKQASGRWAWTGLLFAVLALALAPAIAQNWGGPDAMPSAVVSTSTLLVASLLGGFQLMTRRQQPLRDITVLTALGLSSLIAIGAMGGGRFMVERFTAVDHDWATRLAHWSRSLHLLDGPKDWWLGKGSGRFPAEFALSGELSDQTGDHAWRHEGGRSFLRLSAGKHHLDWGEYYRISQRVPAFVGPLRVEFSIRSDAATAIQVDVCRKHLLYDRDCLYKSVDVPARPGDWQSLAVALPGAGLDHGNRLAPYFIVFSMSVTRPGTRVDVESVRARTVAGENLLANGHFESGTARWFFSSDRHHMPWHIKNMWLHVLFEQGVVGVALLGVLVATSLLRAATHAGTPHTPIAAALTGSLCGLLVVGMFDSILDVPRVAALFLLLMATSLALPRRV